MKSKIILLLVLCLVIFTACNNAEVIVDNFSYAEESAKFSVFEAGVKTSGFKNTTKNTVENGEKALKLAINEVTIPYNQTYVAYDEKENMWKVNFSTKNQFGGDQTVYLTSDGLTVKIVYGE